MHDTQLNVEGNNFLFSMKEGAVCLHNAESLENFLEKNNYHNALKLANKIQEVYKNYFSKPLEVSEDSIAVEILGHIYFEELVERIGNKIPLKLMDNISEKVRAHCSEINIGEKGHDHNRAFWDLLTPIVKKYFR